MSASKISALTELAAHPADGDLIPVVDVSDTTQGAGGTTKFVTKLNLGGKIVGYQITQDTAAASTTTTIALDNSIPQSSEGLEYGTYAYTPKASGNILEIAVSGHCVCGTNNTAIFALFLDSETDARATIPQASAGYFQQSFVMKCKYTTVGTSSQTWKLRFASTGGAATYLNRHSTGEVFGVSNFVTVAFKEYQP